MLKDDRQRRILSLIRAKRVGTQAELTEHLVRAGFEATQSSISRDLEELGIVKNQGRYVLPQNEQSARSRGLLSLDSAGDALVVAKCEPGMSSAIAVEIDRALIPEVVGTLAGEDTIFIAVVERRAQHQAIKKIWELFT